MTDNKTPEPAMPNGVEGLVAEWRADAKMLEDRASHSRAHELRWCADELESALRAADNRDAAGVEANLDAALNCAVSELEMIAEGRDTVTGDRMTFEQAKMIARRTMNALSAAWSEAANTPAAVPAGEAVALLRECYEWLYESKSDGPRVSEGALSRGYYTPEFRAFHARLKAAAGGPNACGGCGNSDPDKVCLGCRHEFYTPPAPVQAAPQEGEVQAVKIGYIDPRNLWLIQESRHAGLWQNCIKSEGAQGEKDVPLYAYAAHPSACELGAVRHDLVTHRIAWRSALVIAKDRADDADDKAYWQHEINAFDRTFAALQHRGDSRGGEGGDA